MPDDAPAETLPRTAGGWLPYLFGRVLFPEAAPDASRASWPALLLVVLLPAFLLYPCRGFHLLEPDEGRYAQIPREMLDAGTWLVPSLQGEAYLDKPPLFYWLVKIAYHLFGVSAQSARLVPAACVHLTVLAVYFLGRRSVGHRAALVAAVMLTVSPGFVGVARLLLLDGLLTLCVTLSLLCGFEAVRTGTFRRGWWVAAALASGLGFLTKGPISEVLLLPPLFAFGVLTRSKARVGVRDGLLFAAVVALVNTPWYVGMSLERPDFVRHFFWEHNVKRFAQPFDHLQPVWYYAPLLAAGFLPGALAGVLYLRQLAIREPKYQVTRSRPGGFWALSGAWCVLFFSCSGSKLPTYILPAFPPLCLALGDYLARSGWAATRAVRLAAAAFAVLVAGLHYGLVPWYAKERSPVGRPELVMPFVADPAVPVVTYPRNLDSVAFATGRHDLVKVRSKDVNQMIVDCHFRPRTVVLFTHDHSYAELAARLPPSLAVTTHVDLRHAGKQSGLVKLLAGTSPWGLCDLAVIEPAEPGTRNPEPGTRGR